MNQLPDNFETTFDASEFGDRVRSVQALVNAAYTLGIFKEMSNRNYDMPLREQRQQVAEHIASVLNLSLEDAVRVVNRAFRLTGVDAI